MWDGKNENIARRSTLIDWIQGEPIVWRGEPPIRDAACLSRDNEPLSPSDLTHIRRSID